MLAPIQGCLRGATREKFDTQKRNDSHPTERGGAYHHGFRVNLRPTSQPPELLCLPYGLSRQTCHVLPLFSHTEMDDDHIPLKRPAVFWPTFAHIHCRGWSAQAQMSSSRGLSESNSLQELPALRARIKQRGGATINDIGFHPMVWATPHP